MSNKVTCEIRNNDTGEVVASATGENDNSEVVARNSAMMKVGNDDDVDWDDDDMMMQCHV